MKDGKKKTLCMRHFELLAILVNFGKGAMLLAQLKELCVMFGLYPNEREVGRVVRELCKAGVLTRQSWVDHRSHLILARKAVYEFWNNTDSQGSATPPRPATMEPYVLQARKIDWLIELIKKRLRAYP